MHISFPLRKKERERYFFNKIEKKNNNQFIIDNFIPITFDNIEKNIYIYSKSPYINLDILNKYEKLPWNWGENGLSSINLIYE